MGRRADRNGRCRQLGVSDGASAAGGGGHGQVAAAGSGVGRAGQGSKGDGLVSDLSSHGRS